jgi:hypothetical protein
MTPEKGQNKVNKSEVKKLELVEVLASKIYNSIIKIGQEQGLTLADPEFVDKVFWALTKAKLRIYNESNELGQND